MTFLAGIFDMILRKSRLKVLEPQKDSWAHEEKCVNSVELVTPPK